MGQADADRRSRLFGVKLKALVAEHLGDQIAVEPQSFPHGAALEYEGRAWILIDGDASASLGRAIAWALRRGAASLSVVAEQGSGTLARRATGFRFPIEVWFPMERTLVPAIAEALPRSPAVSSEHLALAQLIELGGAEPVVEHGVLTGEVRGLEVCRVVDEATTGTFAELGDVITPPSGGIAERDHSGVRLEVGVGAADREAFQLLHGDVPTTEALSRVVRSVADHRRDEAPQHPLNRLVRERYLRWRAIDDPALIGMSSVAPAEPPVPRRTLKGAAPCVAEASTASGDPVVVVFSSGVDLDLVPFVADVQARTGAPVVVVLPSRDRVGLTLDIAAQLRQPVEFRTLDA